MQTGQICAQWARCLPGISAVQNGGSARLRIPGPITLRETGASTLRISIADYALSAGGKIAVTERRRMPRLAAWRPDKQWRAAVMGWRRVTAILGPGPGAGEPWAWEVLDAARRCLAKRRPLPAI
jgi:hypothetical protein